MNNHYEYSLEPIDINVNKNINKKIEIWDSYIQFFIKTSKKK